METKTIEDLVSDQVVIPNNITTATVVSEVVINAGREPVIVKASIFKGEKRLDIRHWDRTDGGELVPTKKGVNILLSDADRLEAAINQAVGYQSEIKADCKCFLPIIVKASVYKNQWRLDVRHWFVERSKKPSPTQKGVNLPLTSGQSLISAIAQVKGAPIQIDTRTANLDI